MRLLPLAARQGRVQLVLLHQGDADQAQDGQPQHGEPHAPEGLHERRDHAVVPALGEVLELVEVVPDPVDLVRGAGQVAEAAPELLLEHVLVDSRRDRDADGPADRPERVRGRRDRGLVGVVHRGEAGQERDSKHGALPATEKQECDHQGPFGRVLVERREDDDAGKLQCHGQDSQAQLLQG